MDTILSPRLRPIVAGIFLLLLMMAIPAPAFAAGEDLWTAKNTRVLITGPTRLNLGFLNQAGAPTSAIVSSLPVSSLEGCRRDSPPQPSPRC